MIYDYECPDCGGQMVLRTNKNTSEKFWGCTHYPDCTGTREAEGDGPDEAAPVKLPSDRSRRNDTRRWERE